MNKKERNEIAKVINDKKELEIIGLNRPLQLLKDELGYIKKIINKNEKEKELLEEKIIKNTFTKTDEKDFLILIRKLGNDKILGIDRKKKKSLEKEIDEKECEINEIKYSMLSINPICYYKSNEKENKIKKIEEYIKWIEKEMNAIELNAKQWNRIGYDDFNDDDIASINKRECKYHELEFKKIEQQNILKDLLNVST